MPFDLGQELQRQGQSITSYLAQRQQQAQGIKDMLMKALIEQKIKERDPMYQLLQRGQAAQAISNIAELGGDVSQFQGIFGAPTTAPGAGTPDLGRAVTPDMGGAVTAPVLPTALGGGMGRVSAPAGFEPETLKRTPFGGFRAETLTKKKGLAGESAAKLTMINQALSDLEGAEKQLFTPEGKFKRGLAFGANIPGGRAFGIGRLIPDVGFGTEARILNSRMNNALEAKLRIETGAAATQEEFNRLQTRFGITGFDTSQSAKNKIRRLKEFMRNAIITIDPAGNFVYKTKDAKLDRELNVNIPQLQKLGLDPNRYEIIGVE